MTNRTDNFNRADSGSAMGTPSDGGSAWVPYGTSQWGITSNQGYKVATNTANEAAVLESSVSAVDIQATVAAVGSQGGNGPIGRGSSDTDYILTQWLGGSTYIFKKVGGSFTQLATTAGSLSAGDVLKLRCDSSNNLTSYRNGSSVITATDAAGSTNTQHGLGANGGGLTQAILWDDFSITAIVAAGTVAPPARAFPLSILQH